MKIETINPIDNSKIYWFDNEFTKNNRPELDHSTFQKKESFKYIIEKGKNVLDAGAHIGDYGVPLAHALVNSGRGDILVYCIEPDKQKCEFISSVCELNKLTNVKVLNYGLSDKFSKYVICDKGRGGKNDSRVFPRKNTGAWQYKESDDGLSFVTLDYLYEKEEIGEIGFFWFDVQWMELDVLRGGREFLKKYKPLILMEYWPVKDYMKDGVSVNDTRRGTRDQLSQDMAFQEVFKDYGICISDKGQEFQDILLEFK